MNWIYQPIELRRWLFDERSLEYNNKRFVICFTFEYNKKSHNE